MKSFSAIPYAAAVGIIVTLSFTAPAKAARVSVDMLNRAAEPTPPPKTENPLLQAVNMFNPVDIDGMKKLLAGGAQVNVLAKDEYGFQETPLTKAIKRVAPKQSVATNIRRGEPVDVIALLLENGADPNMPNGEGVPPLFIAASEGDVAVMELLIAKGAITNKPYKNQYGQETGLVEYTAGRSYAYNAFVYLLEKAVPFNPDEVLKNLSNNGGNEPFLRAFLAYPVSFSASALEQLEAQRRGTNVTSLARKHNQIVDTARAAHKQPKLLFKPVKAITTQITPPATDNALVQAIAQKDLSAVKKLIAEGADVNSVTSRTSPLKNGYARLVSLPSVNLALNVGSSDIALYLLEHGADADLTDGGDHGDSPLSLAVRADNVEVVQALIKKGADVNRETWNIHLTPLAVTRSVAVAKALLDAGADPNQVETMQWMVINKNPDVVGYVLSRGGKLDQNSLQDGNTPLHHLIQSSYTTAPDPAYIQFLVENGAPLDALNYQKQTPYDLAIVQKFDKVAAILSQKGGAMGDPETALANAIVQDDVASATRALAALGKIKNQQVLLGLVSYRTKHVSREMLELLSAHGADYTQDHGEQGTLLHMAKDAMMIDYLIEHGANVDAEGRGHATPLHIMVQIPNLEAVRTLLKHKAFPNARNDSGVTPLCLALQGPQDKRPADGPAVDWKKDPIPFLEIIKLLAQSGADPKMMDDRGCRPWNSDAAYEAFRKQAEAVIAENAGTVAIKTVEKKQTRYVEVPYSEINPLFMAVRDHALQNTPKAQGVHPVLQAAQALYAKYPQSADDLAHFIKRVRFHPEDDVMIWRSGSDSGLQQDTGESLLHTAAYYGDSELAAQIIAITGPLSLVDKQGKTPLFYAANSYSVVGVEKALQMVDLLTGKGGENINETDRSGNLALLVHGGETFKGDEPTNRYQMIRGLLERGADPTLGDSSYNIADMALAGKNSALEYKRQKAAEAYQSLLDDLAKKNVLPGKKASKPRFDRENPLHMAVASLNLATVKRLMGEGAAFQSDTEKKMLLTSAISSGDQGLEMAQFLLEKGAIFDPEDPALWAAALQQNESAKMLAFVLSHAEPPADALQELSYRSSHTSPWGATLSTLLNKGVLMNYCVENPLAKAVASEDITAVKVLLQYGARKDACPKKPVSADSTKKLALKEALAQ